MELNNEKATEWWMDHLSGTLDTNKTSKLMSYLKQHEELHQELLQSAEMWEQMGQIETTDPSPAMDQRFEAMLSGYSANSEKSTPAIEALYSWLAQYWKVSVTAMAIGMLLGIFISPQPNNQVNELAGEVQDMKKMLMLAMIEKPQSQERIKAVNMVSDLKTADQKVIDALVSTLNQDESVNVRLSALEALLAYGNQPPVRQALVSSIALQDSPLIQVALADAMIGLQEKTALDPFQSLLEHSELNHTVKIKLEQTVKQLKEI